MSSEKQKSPHSKINEAIHKLLIEEHPSNASQSHLKDIIELLMGALRNGELYIDLNDINASSELKLKGWPNAHKEALLQSGWTEGVHPPISLNGNQLSWKRWDYEMNELINQLCAKKELRSFKRDFKSSSQQIANTLLNKEQLSAVKAVETNGVILLSGGPGTGKTSTVVQMLIQILSNKTNAQIGLAAPTGKAAKRLKDALQQNLKTVHERYRDKLCLVPCTTLHSWLKARPGGYGKNKSSQINLDLLIIDEMSMVEIALMKAILEALPQTTRLILVGDSNQLPPVGCGAVWQELQKDKVLKLFGDGAIHLKKVYRNRGNIALLAETIREQGSNVFWNEISQFKKSSNAQLHFANSINLPNHLIENLKRHQNQLKELAKYLRTQLDEKNYLTSEKEIDIAELSLNIFDYLEQLMVLCPKKNGWWGVNHLNSYLLDNHSKEGVANWPEGTPIICNENQPEFGLSNGDVGITIGEEEKQKILFRVFSSEGTISARLLHPARIRKINPAFAITIHKAQGSESNHVILIWPNSTNKEAHSSEEIEFNKEYEQRLLYTAITRAKERLDIIIKNY